ncbi:hypothetical protein AQUCO_07300029v1 [Aquilegia coerulea]|uniref:2'-phosphotransferase n=1 Tax=Aquilegia coerulea TaxID=218851 RepID=A0A2G5C9X5_AQUCA|nr:hypothetical protein AQUCO_07300029v1 [Aquilegia coerulea]
MEKKNNISSFSTSSARSFGGRGKCLDSRDEQQKKSTGVGSGQTQGRGGGNTNDDHLDKLFVGLDFKDQQPKRSAGRGQGGSTTDNQIDALGRLLTCILHHMASQLNMRSDGYVRVVDILKLNMKTFANIPLSSHTVDDIREAVRKDNKQRFSLFDENGELFIRANQGHTIAVIKDGSLIIIFPSILVVVSCLYQKYGVIFSLHLVLNVLQSVECESLLKPILSPEEAPGLHIQFSSGLPTDGKVIRGMRRDVNVLIFMDIRIAVEDGMKIYISKNKVILTEGFDGVVPLKYFEKIEA